MHQDREVLDEFRNFKPAKSRLMSVSPDDVRTGRNMYGAYAVADDIYVPQVTDELVIKA